MKFCEKHNIHYQDERECFFCWQEALTDKDFENFEEFIDKYALNAVEAKLSILKDSGIK